MYIAKNMTTREFISKCVNGKITRQKTVSSVIYNGSNCIYSYGYHYPLLMKTKAGWILNDIGYSNTTAKHIAWAKPFSIGSCKYDCASGFFSKAWTNGSILEAIEKESDIIIKSLESLSKRAFKQKEVLENRLEQLHQLGKKIRVANI